MQTFHFIVNKFIQMQSKDHVNYIDPCYMSAFVVGVPGGAVQTKTVKVGSTQNPNLNVHDCMY